MSSVSEKKRVRLCDQKLVQFPHKTTQNILLIIKRGAKESTMDSDGVLGYACCLVAAIFFGSNYVPVKKLTNLGDGVFFSVCMTLGVFTVGVVVCLMRSFPKFEYQAMFGGSLWAIGNLCVVPIVKSIGLALGMMIWSGACMLSGWASARFGILGLDKEEVSRPGLNGFGVTLASVLLRPLMLLIVE